MKSRDLSLEAHTKCAERLNRMQTELEEIERIVLAAFPKTSKVVVKSCKANAAIFSLRSVLEDNLHETYREEKASHPLYIGGRNDRFIS